MKPRRAFSIISMLALIVFAASSAFATAPTPVTLTVGDASVNAKTSNTVSIPVTVDNPSEIAGAAFTVVYDTEDLTLTVDSTFFDTFQSQFSALPGAGIPYVDPDDGKTYVDITYTDKTVKVPTTADVGDGTYTVTYTQPLVKGEETQMGTMIAAARVQAGATNTTLFTLTFDLISAYNGIYPIEIVPSMINNTDAGYSAAGEPIPYLVGAIDSEQDLFLAFPEIPVDSINPGSITVTGSINYDTYTLDINQPFNVDTEEYVDIAAGGEWHVWFHPDTNVLELNNVTIKKETITNFADWSAGVLPDHIGITDTTLDMTTVTTGDIFSIKITEEMYALVKITGFTTNDSMSFEMMPLGDWNYGAIGPPVEGEYSISGTITDADTGQPIPGVWIEVFSDAVQCGTRAMADENGVYTATGLIAGDYRVEYWPPWDPIPGQPVYQEAFYCSTCGDTTTTHIWDEATPVTVDESNTSVTGIDMVFSAGCSISGVITDKDVNRIGQTVWVEAWSDSTWSWGGAKSEAGAYTITGLADADDYRVTIMPYWDWETGQLVGPDFMQIFYTSSGGTVMWDNAEFVACGETNIDFILDFTGKQGKISGRVTSDGYHGVADVWVSAWPEFEAAIPTGTDVWGGGASTDAGGYYTISGLDDSAVYCVDVWAEGYAYQVQCSVPAPADGIDGIDFILTKGVSISGTVKDEGGKPIPWVWVDAWSPSTGAWGGAISGENPDFTFNEAGAYTITGLPPANDYVVMAWPCNYPSQEYPTPVDVTQGDATNINFILKAGKYIAGTVTKAGTGDAVPGVWIDAYSDSTWGWGGALTDEAGNYTIANLPDATDYIVAYWPDPMAGEQYQYVQVFYKEEGTTSDWMEATRIDIITLGSVDGIDLALSAGASIEGYVKRGEQGVPWIWVDAWSVNTGSWGGAETNDQGYYKIMGLVAEDSGYVVTIFPFNQAPITKENVTAPSTNINFDLGTEIGNVIKGTVEDSTGTSIPDVWVNVWSPSTGSWGSGRTDQDGKFEISGLAQAADFELNIWSPEFGNYMQTDVSSHDLTWYDTNDPVLVEFSAGVTISGTISGLNLAGWDLWVDAWSETSYSWGSTFVTTSGSGSDSYTIKGLSDTVTDYRVSINGFNPATGASIMNMFYTEEGGTTRWDDADLVNLSGGSVPGIDFTVDMGSSISGTVSIEGVTAPDPALEWIWVDAWSETSWSWGGGVTDENGNYVITGLASASDYRVSAWKEGYPWVFYNETASTPVWDNATLVDVSTEDQEGIDITLSTGGSITGTVNDTNGRAVADVWIDVYSQSQQFGMGSFTDQTGEYEVNGLITGVTDYEVTAYPMGNYKWVTKTGKKPGDVVNFTLSEGFTFYGELVTSGAQPYTAGAWADIWSASFYGWAEVSSGSNTFSIDGLSDGDYNISIWPNEPGYVQIMETLDTLASTSTSEAEPRTFTLNTGLSISGTVTDSDGNGIPGTFVDAWSDTQHSWGSDITAGADGAYTITGLVDDEGAGSYVVSVWSPIYPWTERTGISAGATVNFTLSVGGSITGTVRYNGNPQEGVWVEAYSSSTQSWAGGTTGSDGKYTLPGLKEKTSGGATVSDYVVTVYPEDLANQFKSGKSVGDTVDFDLTAGNSISGTIYDSAGAGDQPLADVKVKIFNAGDSNNGLWVNNVFTDASGAFEIKGLSTGDYNIKAQKEGYGAVWYDENAGPDYVSTTERVGATAVASGTTGITFKLTAE